MPAIFALTARGLEAVCAREIAALNGAAVRETGYRRVAADYSGSLAALPGLRTVDDVYFAIGQWEEIGHTRSVLNELRQHAAGLDFSVADACAALRPLHSPPIFSVSVSFVGRRNYSSDEVKTVVAAGIQAAAGWQPTPDDREADLNVRLFIEQDRAFIGLRVAKSPLHDRPYQQIQRPGALKPPVAAALLDLCGAEAGMRLLDPFCGTGTILIEGALAGLVPFGGDLEAAAAQAARTNASTAGLILAINQWDSRQLPLASRSIERVVTNLPWGRQIQTGDALETLYRDSCHEIERVLIRGGRAALLTNAPDLLHFERLRVDERLTLSLFGQTPTAVIVTAIR